MAGVTRSWEQAFDHGERRRLGLLYGFVALLHLLGFGLLIGVGVKSPAFAGVGVLAYTFGLRHAFDADHISAIDNTTRKLLQQGRKPVAVGFFFSLGHCTVVFGIALLLAYSVRPFVSGIAGRSPWLHHLGSLVGTGVSGLFLLIIGLFNLLVLLDVVRTYRRMGSDQCDPSALHTDLVAGGPFIRLFGGLFKFVNQSWHMYPIGVLFGLGFDTATEVALLSISAGAAARGFSFLALTSLPVLFTAGMSLMDTTDGAFMSKAYSWAFSNPMRKVFYNLTVTSLSVFVALLVGSVEGIQLFILALKLDGPFWNALRGLDFETLGLVMAAAFILTWAGAFAYFKLGRVEERWSTAAGRSGPS